MKEILRIRVRLSKPLRVEGGDRSAAMLPFTGKAEGELFTGEIIGEGVDTQLADPEGFSLSARYMLEGRDFTGEPCRLFIENNGTSMESCTPRIVTDSEALRYLHTARLRSRVKDAPGGVLVHIFLEE